MKTDRNSLFVAGMFAASLAVATLASAEILVQEKMMADARKAIAAAKDPIPGPRTCFWSRGPASGDPYLNIAYPDAATFYWAATFTVPAGAKLSIEGKFPHSRYMSFISYDEAGRPIESVADYLIKPKAGSSNPYLPNADRNNANRDYGIEVVDARPDPTIKTGMNLAGQSRDKLHTPKYGGGQQVILYRIYAVDKGQDETGGGGLPMPVLTMPDGKTLRGADACGALKTRQPLQLDAAAMAVPMEAYYKLLATAATISPTHPATNPPTWYQQLDREALYGMYTGRAPSADARKSEGGFYPNLDNQYIRTIVNRKLGKVFVLRGKAASTPRTVNGDAKMGTGDLRYWSFCSNQGFANTRVNDCVHDENVPVGPDGYYTIVLSRAADRPRNAFPQCGVAWLPMADDGDGAGDADVTVLQLRNMLGTQNFKHAIQAIGKVGDEAKDMGDYFPRGRYLSTSAFEIAVPCLMEKR
ncbi:MAG: hypothetical protein ABL931_15305 [Usitatibacteraceae bacterium]